MCHGNDFKRRTSRLAPPCSATCRATDASRHSLQKEHMRLSFREIPYLERAMADFCWTRSAVATSGRRWVGAGRVLRSPSSTATPPLSTTSSAASLDPAKLANTVAI
ncbi:hypothetical protein E2C01_047029 [Portunus trituberculatus]|uniref:Uncharacterized protein n=1 Tax=Portunus trituberculatus TaxID=210409 RepID=A0A5B7G6U5_PORTR|nr:hypothetical protein [Portunus trituberculatus]